MHKIQCIVIGAGVIGLAIGAALSSLGLKVVVLEKEGNIGQHAKGINIFSPQLYGAALVK